LLLREKTENQSDPSVPAPKMAPKRPRQRPLEGSERYPKPKISTNDVAQ